MGEKVIVEGSNTPETKMIAQTTTSGVGSAIGVLILEAVTTADIGGPVAVLCIGLGVAIITGVIGHQAPPTRRVSVRGENAGQFDSDPGPTNHVPGSPESF